MRRALPSGTVTLLFTDIEGSTRLLQELGSGYVDVLAEHHRLLREVWTRHRGVEVDTAGDAFFVAFSHASDAVAAASEAQLALAAGPVRVRMGLHTGEPTLALGSYVGLDVHRAARIAAAGHGGQVLLSQATADLAGVEARDLGLHRLKDLSAPERLYQLGDDRFPPLKTLRKTNLPTPATPFLGRAEEVERIGELLQRREIRLITLTGPGGTGKTRLALQAAAAAADGFDHGVFWVPLAAIAGPALVESAAAQALGAKDALAAAVGDQELLLLFDNFEHVLDAAPVVSEALASCPHLTVLVTSREPLHIDGEWEIAVDPLDVHEAAELFRERATAVQADFQENGEVVEICRRLDCLPLAIELAAARVKTLQVSSLLERLERRLPLLQSGSRSAPERQRTLRGAIAWSHELLQQQEQTLFARLAVFSGGCTLEAAEEICSADLDGIGSLVDKSLLRRTDDRYWMLETIREFAAEQLEEIGEATASKDRHAAWFTALGEHLRPELEARRGREGLDRIEADHANFRAALDHVLGREDAAAALQLSGTLSFYWQARGPWTEGYRYLAAAIALGEHADPEQLIEPMWAAGLLALWMNDLDEGRERATQLLDLSRRSGSVRGELAATHLLAREAYVRGDLERADPLQQETLRLARAGDDGWFLSVALDNLGDLRLHQGRYDQAIELFEESLAVGEARGDLDRRARELINLGSATSAIGDGARALRFFRRGLEAAIELGHRTDELNALSGIAACRARDGDPITAARLIGWTTEELRRMGAEKDDPDDETITLLREALGPDNLTANLVAGAALSRREAVSLGQGNPA